MAQETFKRYEKKYIISPSQYENLMSKLQEYIVADKYGSYTICNIYYDTPNYELIQKSISGPFYKEKLRLRSYGTVAGDGKVFLEIKKKSDGVVYKRRKQMPLSVAADFIREGIKPQNAGQIGEELYWFLKRYQVSPKVYIAYDREAYVCKEDELLRITFDRNIRYREDRLDLAEDTQGTLLLPQDQMVMEIKIADSFPFWLARLLSECEIYPSSFSKYGTYYKQKILRENSNKGEKPC